MVSENSELRDYDSIPGHITTAVIGSPIGRSTIGPAPSGLGFGRGRCHVRRIEETKAQRDMNTFFFNKLRTLNKLTK